MREAAARAGRPAEAPHPVPGKPMRTVEGLATVAFSAFTGESPAGRRVGAAKHTQLVGSEKESKA